MDFMMLPTPLQRSCPPRCSHRSWPCSVLQLLISLRFLFSGNTRLQEQLQGSFLPISSTIISYLLQLLRRLSGTCSPGITEFRRAPLTHSLADWWVRVLQPADLQESMQHRSPRHWCLWYSHRLSDSYSLPF